MDRKERQDAEDLVRKQLTLRAVVWDAAVLEEGETAKLEKEMEIFGICRIDVRACRQNQKNQMAQITPVRRMGYLEKYKKMYQLLRDAGAAEERALLVTEDAGLAAYVYECRSPAQGWDESAELANTQELKRGMAVVYYEREDGGESVKADIIVQGFEEIGVQFLDRIHKRRNGLPWNILYTRRTCVREIALSDLDEMYELYEGEGITDYTEPLFDRQKEEEYTKSYISYMYRYFGYGMWVVCDRISGKLLGRAGIEHHDEGDGKVCMELGYIIRREYQNQGYDVEVCQAIIEYAREELQISRLHCFIHPQNCASIRVAEKLGFLRCVGACERQETMIHFCRELK